MNSGESASARWAQIVGRQEAGGLSVAQFCRREGVAAPSFYAWRRRLRAEVPSAFVELKVQTPVEATLELVLPGELRVRVRRGFDRELLRELLAALESPA